MAEQTISQALRRVKKIKGELAENLVRAQDGVTYKRNEEPAFSFMASLEKASNLRNELLELETKIAVTNAAKMIEWDGKTIALAQAVKMLKELKGQISWLDGLKHLVKPREVTTQEEAAYDFETDKRVTKKVEYVCALPEAKRADLVDKAKATFDRLNDLVENTNHRTVLIG